MRNPLHLTICNATHFLSIFLWPSRVPRLGMTDDFLASHKVAVEEVEPGVDLSAFRGA